MKKTVSLLTAVLCLFVFLVLPVSATEEETTENTETVTPPEITERYMCDVDNSGGVEAADARTILRYSVDLEQIEAEDIIYADGDMNGSITAADARLALRTSVSLEEKVKYAFVISESKDPTCAEDGFVKAECALTETKVDFTFKKLPHTIPPEVYCKGEGVCSVCSQAVTVEVKHSFAINYSEGIKLCYYCGKEEYFTHEHSFANGNCVCGISAKSAFESAMTEYLIKNGIYEEYIHYISEYIEPLSFAVVYDESLDFSYAYCGFGVDQDGVILYYDFNFDFEENTIEVLLYNEEMAMAYAYGSIIPSKVDETSDGDSITLTTFDVIPELYGFENAFRQMMEGAVYDTVKWLKDFAADKGFKNVKEAFSDFTQIK